MADVVSAVVVVVVVVVMAAPVESNAVVFMGRAAAMANRSVKRIDKSDNDDGDGDQSRGCLVIIYLIYHGCIQYIEGGSCQVVMG